MKKIIVTAFALAVATLAVQAQDKPDAKHDRSKGGHHKEFYQKLNLSEEQKTQFKSLNEDFRKQMKDLKSNEDITVKDQKEKMKTIREAHKAKTQALLTSEQKAQVQKMKEERKTKHEAGSKDRMAKMKERLNLTDEQSTKLKAQHTEMSSQFKAVRENKSLTDEQRKEQFKALKKKQMEGMKSILTEEQLKKMKERKPRRSADNKNV